MNLGDGLKLETQILNGKPKLIVAPCAKESKNHKLSSFKKVLQVQPPALKPTGQILKAAPNGHVFNATRNTPVTNEKLFLQKRTVSGLSQTKSERNTGSFVSKKASTNPVQQIKYTGHDLIMQQVNTARKPSEQKSHTIKKTSQSTAFSKQKTPKKSNISAEDLRESLVCLTREQFQQILKTINQATNDTQRVQDDSEQTSAQECFDDTADNKSKEESLNGLLSKASNALPVQDGQNLLNEQHKTAIGNGQRVQLMNAWQDGDFFSTLGERERDKTILEAKKSQWKKELDEQLALKKKIKENDLDKTKYGLWLNCRPEKISCAKVQTILQPEIEISTIKNAEADNLLSSNDVMHTVSNGPVGKPSSFSSPCLPAAIRTAFVMGEAAPLDHPFSAQKREQQKRWVEELNKQREEDNKRKMQEKMKRLEVEEHDRWALHFDSLKKDNYQQLPFNIPVIQEPVYESVIPEHQVPIHLNSEEEKAFENSDESGTQKSSFLRSMTALLDPVQIEERDRKRQKQLEHQRAIAAQVEEKRRRKQMEEELRLREEQEEEQRLALERQLIQKQYEDDVLKQKQKEEVLTLKTKELYQSMQRAQEEAQKLKQEQRIRALAQKGHNISNLQMSLANSGHLNSARAQSSRSSLNPEVCSSASYGKTSQELEMVVSPRIDTAVQTDDFKFGVSEHSEGYIPEAVHRENSPDISVEFKTEATSKKQKTDMMHVSKKNTSSKENKNLSNESNETIERRESEQKVVQKCTKRREWNITKADKQYMPASERYPRGHQKQREQNKARSRTELLHLVERNTSRNPISKNVSPSPREDKKENNPVTKNELIPKREYNVKRLARGKIDYHL
ncbi:coiled-coil domain-containing protein 66 isoform X2 [Pleurodeles waltl]|uniref:coiled-coil domain-containing protein 66 isoform X2 n=1 Tax=Pleurodeles waltl TaxID=8319 RepID=UPI0037096BA1